MTVISLKNKTQKPIKVNNYTNIRQKAQLPERQPVDVREPGSRSTKTSSWESEDPLQPTKITWLLMKTLCRKKQKSYKECTCFHSKQPVELFKPAAAHRLILTLCVCGEWAITVFDAVQWQFIRHSRIRVTTETNRWRTHIRFYTSRPFECRLVLVASVPL